MNDIVMRLSSAGVPEDLARGWTMMWAAHARSRKAGVESESKFWQEFLANAHQEKLHETVIIRPLSLAEVLQYPVPFLVWALSVSAFLLLSVLLSHAHVDKGSTLMLVGV